MKDTRRGAFAVLAAAISIASVAFWGGCGGDEAENGNGDGATILTIAVTPAAPSVAAGAEQQFAATATFSDETTADVTAAVRWESSDTSVADFLTPSDDAGLATAVAAGSATITATHEASGVSGEAAVTVAALSGEAAPLYPDKGADWNDYVANDGASIFSATDTACDPASAGPGYSACIHGGMMRMVEATGLSSCDGLTASDSLGALRWVCDGTTNDVRMVSVDFAEGKGLSDLIDFDGADWREMNVTLYRGGKPYLATEADKLWGNDVVRNNSADPMVTEGQVHIVTEDPDAQYTVGADRVSLLVKPGVKMSVSAAGNPVVLVEDRRFFWFEGAIDALNVRHRGIDMLQTVFSVIHNSVIGDALSSGVWLEHSSNNLIRRTSVYGCGDDGVYLERSNNNTLRNIIAAHNHRGVTLQPHSSGNLLFDITATNNGAEGLNVRTESKDNIFLNVTAANNGDDGIYVLGASNNLFINSTAANTNTAVFVGPDSHGSTMMNVVAANQSWHGIRLRADDGTIVNSASAHSGTYGYYLDNGSTGNLFSGLLKVGDSGTSDCDVAAAGAEPGIDGDCKPEGESDCTTMWLISLDDSFAGKVSSDSVNEHGAGGAEGFASIDDWVNFENPFRGWGKDGDAFPDNSNRGECDGGTCRIWDWSLSDTDEVLRGVLALPTGDDVLTHTWSDAGTTTFLRNAVEIIGDNAGNGNGLCESGEVCLFTPNIGSYQGHGELVPAGEFTDGVVTGVTLLRYEHNGR